MRRPLALALAITLAAPAIVGAQGDDSMSFEVDKERTARQRVLIGSLLGGALVVGGIGLLFHLDSRDKSDEVSASGPHTGRVYTREVDDTRRAALRSRAVTVAAYGAGAGLVIASLVVFLVTDPGTETIVLGDRAAARPSIGLEPVAGGALVAGGWSF
jgi:hypothetical protein